MNLLKFRAWDKNNLKMFIPDNLGLGTNGVLSVGMDGSNYVISNFVLMQYTGLKDKNSVDVYDGDIIIFDNTDIGGERITGEVMFNTDRSLSGLEWGIWTKKGYYRTDFLGDIEVIGNIHKNPELMEE